MTEDVDFKILETENCSSRENHYYLKSYKSSTDYYVNKISHDKVELNIVYLFSNKDIYAITACIYNSATHKQIVIYPCIKNMTKGPHAINICKETKLYNKYYNLCIENAEKLWR